LRLPDDGDWRDPVHAERYLALGELALDGPLVFSVGVLPAIAAHARDIGIICHAHSGTEVAWAAEDLRQPSRQLPTAGAAPTQAAIRSNARDRYQGSGPTTPARLPRLRVAPFDREAATLSVHCAWITVEAHNAFRSSAAFTEWRALVGQYYAGPPEVEHTETVVSTF
jgi:hypothetical protein